jgi:DNA modification methylase
MPFKYNPPTRSLCTICEELQKVTRTPVIHTQNGRASSANSYPFHNWYNFVLGYTPEFPEYLIDKFKINANHFVVDPFMGTGTTLITCKQNGIPSSGIDANDFFIDVAESKLNWDLDSTELESNKTTILNAFLSYSDDIDFENDTLTNQLTLLDTVKVKNYKELLKDGERAKLLDTRYISDKPLVKLNILKDIIEELMPSYNKSFFLLALASIIVPVSNIKYGPGFGVAKAKDDVNVLKYFKDKVERMIDDIKNQKKNLEIKAKVFHGDARNLDKIYKSNSIDFMITSPPYPGDHEYTKHTKLELIFMGYANTIEEFRVIKKRMLRGSTTNIYKEDKEKEAIKDIVSIQKITDLIDERLKADGATSGFEKLYTKLVWEYFGGMYNTFLNAKNVLKDNGKFSLLVSDSHAFKMTHIKTAEILGEIAIKAGFKSIEIELWQNKISTSHSYYLHENILTLTK